MNSQFPSAALLRSAFFNEADTPFLLLDKDLHVLDCNSAFTRSIGIMREDVLGKHISSISPGIEHTPRMLQYLEVLKTGETIFIDDHSEHPSEGLFQSIIKVFRVGEGLGIVSRNIAEFRESIEELETIVHHAARDLHPPLERMQDIIMLAQTMVNDMEEAGNFFRMLGQHAENMKAILNTLGNAVGARTGQICFQPLDLNGLLDELISLLSFTEGYAEVRFERDVQVSRLFSGDKLLLLAALAKVTENSILYRRRDGRQCVVKFIIQEAENGISIHVEDNGRGIPADQQKNVFRMAVRKEEVERQGMGLHYARHTMKRLGGRITLRSDEQNGTIVSLYVPSLTS